MRLSIVFSLCLPPFIKFKFSELNYITNNHGNQPYSRENRQIAYKKRREQAPALQRKPTDFAPVGFYRRFTNRLFCGNNWEAQAVVDDLNELGNEEYEL